MRFAILILLLIGNLTLNLNQPVSGGLPYCMQPTRKVKVGPAWRNSRIRVMNKSVPFGPIEELLSVYITSKEPVNNSVAFKASLFSINEMFIKALAAGASVPDLKMSKFKLPCVVQPMDS